MSFARKHFSQHAYVWNVRVIHPSGERVAYPLGTYKRSANAFAKQIQAKYPGSTVEVYPE